MLQFLCCIYNKYIFHIPLYTLDLFVFPSLEVKKDSVRLQGACQILWGRISPHPGLINRLVASREKHWNLFNQNQRKDHLKVIVIVKVKVKLMKRKKKKLTGNRQKGNVLNYCILCSLVHINMEHGYNFYRHGIG